MERFCLFFCDCTNGHQWGKHSEAIAFKQRVTGCRANTFDNERIYDL